MLDASGVPGCPVSTFKPSATMKPRHQCKLLEKYNYELSYSLATAANSNDSTPCTNRPIQCPAEGCKHTIWGYSLEAHYDAVHPAHEKPSLSLAYHEMEMVKQMLSCSLSRRQRGFARERSAHARSRKLLEACLG